MLQFESKGRKKPMSLFKSNQAEGILFYLSKVSFLVLFSPWTDLCLPEWGEGELDEGSQKVQTSSYRINKYLGYNVQHDKYN